MKKFLYIIFAIVLIIPIIIGHVLFYLSKLHHPDKGGDSKRFMEITEAKNKCLIYVKNKV